MRPAKRKYGSRDVYGRLQICSWLDDTERPDGMNQRGKSFFLEIKEIDKLQSRNAVILYFMITRFDMGIFHTMQNSVKKQKSYFAKVRLELKQYAVEQKWEPIFRRDIDAYRKRAEHIFTIIRKDLEETELYPYFEAVGFERLVDFSVGYIGGDDEQANQLEQEISKWNADHQEEIAAHMKRMGEQIRNRDAHRQRVKEKDKAEKEARRLAKKAQNEEVKEIKRNAVEHRKRDRSLGYAGDYYWNHRRNRSHG